MIIPRNGPVSELKPEMRGPDCQRGACLFLYEEASDSALPADASLVCRACLKSPSNSSMESFRRVTLYAIVGPPPNAPETIAIRGMPGA
ncbi:MAG: hypothetical protein PHQ97_02170 [Desulfobacterales bacterium]|nr:hypothetical protein [Desulfobacterales bacterium]